jgi:ferredoxin
MRCIARIDEVACSAHGDCVLVAPEAFEVDGVARVIGDAPREVLIEAAEACPAAAISVVDADTDLQVYP